MVTVIVYTYNHKNYIRQCIDSVLAQITDFEYLVLIHDDCSTDGTITILEEYEKKYKNVKVIYENENQYSKGVYLFSIVKPYLKTKYIAGIEGDDYWINSNKLQKQYSFLQKHPEYIAVGHMTNAIDKNGNKVRCFLNTRPGDYTEKDNEKWQLYAHYSSYFFRNIFDKMNNNLFDEFVNVKAPGDRKYPVLFLHFGKLFVLSEVYSTYRYMSNPDSFTSNKENQRLEKIYMEYESLGEFANLLGLNIKYNKIKNKVLLQSYKKYIVRKDLKSFKKILQIRNQYFKDIIFCILLTPQLIINKIIEKRVLLLKGKMFGVNI